MAWIAYVKPGSIPVADRVDDPDNIMRIHGVHSRIMRRHCDLYRDLMFSRGPLTRLQREMIAVAVSATNACRY